MDTLCHSREEIERAASRLPCVPTDNHAALIELGFERMCPDVATGYESHLWERVVDSGYRTITMRNGRRKVVQRAYLVKRAA